MPGTNLLQVKRTETNQLRLIFVGAGMSHQLETVYFICDNVLKASQANLLPPHTSYVNGSAILLALSFAMRLRLVTLHPGSCDHFAEANELRPRTPTLIYAP